MLVRFLFVLFIINSLLSQSFGSEFEYSQTSVYTFQSFLQPYGRNTNETLNIVSISPDLRKRWENKLSMRINPKIIFQPDNKSSEERLLINPSELFVKYKAEGFQMQAGSSVYNWGVTNIYNPMDFINSRAYFNPLVPEKIGVLNLTSNIKLPQGYLDLLFIPKNNKSKLPGSQSRWLPRELYIPEGSNGMTTLLMPNEISYTLLDDPDDEGALSNNFGLRYGTSYKSLDFSIAFYEGMSLQPLIIPKVTGVIKEISPRTVIAIDPEVSLLTKFYKRRNLGFTLVFDNKFGLLKIVTNYISNQHEDGLLPNWSNESTIEIEENFTLSDKSSFVGFAQINSVSSSLESKSNLNFQNIFKNSVIFGAKYFVREDTVLTPVILQDLESNSSLMNLSIEKGVKENLKINFAIIQIDGSRESPLGIFSKNDDVSLSVIGYF